MTAAQAGSRTKAQLGGGDFDPDNIAELFWTAHTDPKDAWQTEYRFTGV